MITAAFMRSRDSTDGIAEVIQDKDDDDDEEEEESNKTIEMFKAQETDLIFLDAFIEDPLVRSYVQVRNDKSHCIV